MISEKHEEISAIYLIALESGDSINEHKKLHRFLLRNRLGDAMSLHAHRALIVSYDENNNSIVRELSFPMVTTTALDDEKFIIYDNDFATLFHETDLIYFSTDVDGPLDFSCLDEAIGILEKMKKDSFSDDSEDELNVSEDGFDLSNDTECTETPDEDSDSVS